MGSISRPEHPAEPASISMPAASPASPLENSWGNFAGPVLGGPGRPARPRPDLNPSQGLCPQAASRLASRARPPPGQGPDFATRAVAGEAGPGAPAAVGAA